MRGDFYWPLRVYYEDTDAAGIVYYANYLKFMERARTEWLRSLGFNQEQLRHEHGIVFAVTRLSSHYLQPARLDDQLSVSVCLKRMARASFELGQHVVRDDGATLCEGQVTIVCLAAQELKPRKFPSFLLTELRRED